MAVNKLAGVLQSYSDKGVPRGQAVRVSNTKLVTVVMTQYGELETHLNVDGDFVVLLRASDTGDLYPLAEGNMLAVLERPEGTYLVRRRRKRLSRG